MVLEGGGGLWEKCGYHLMLGRTERSGIDDCVNPSLQHQKANTPGLVATCPSLASSPDLISPGPKSLFLIDEDGVEVHLYFDGLAE